MYRERRISVVIPCHNEEKGIPQVIRSLPMSIDEVIVVDSNCSDGTARVSKALGATVVAEANPGYGAAYKAGLPRVSGDITVTLDGRGVYPAEQIEELVDHLLDTETDFVSASRFPLLDPASMTFSRKLANMMLATAMMLLYGTAVRDSHSAMWAYRSNIYPRFKLTSDGMPFSEEIKVEAIRAKDVRFDEYHVNCHQEIADARLEKWRDDLKSLFLMVQKRFQ
ncbi:MAG: glycosyltransferase family 2 protein [Candidatus Krumholzibacteria bacterium]|nr:glycosyltransferase family 2 protein [Candidatus Krumholzibacteria bacterium]